MTKAQELRAIVNKKLPERLNKPVTLGEILILLDKSTQKDEWRNPYWYGLDIVGTEARITAMYGSGVEEHYDYIGIELDLTKDPEHQDDEVIEKIIDLIKEL